ncbi:YggS family pyridoxal phosphate-dependent enzyme [Ruminococcaceae bacterium OttesenSCG-928-A16]|nr:YggS family pyridoxal phosphate-dependent enzyme [Ruminococcaceae bacterium OttesenSCG-928-A16]
MKQYYNDITARVQQVRENIEVAANKVGRKASEVTLLGVTKTQSAQAVRQLLQAGVTDIGENRVQELLQKEPFLEDLPHTTHLIGHLQRNKAKFLPGHISMLQSLDSPKTLQAVEKAFATQNKPLDVLIEVNIGDEASKSGVSVPELEQLVELTVASPVVRLRGLMAIPPICEGDLVRRYFEQIYHLFVDIKAKKMDNKAINILSMGMSADYGYAVMEGATMVRVGSTLFGPRI